MIQPHHSERKAQDKMDGIREYSYKLLLKVLYLLDMLALILTVGILDDAWNGGGKKSV